MSFRANALYVPIRVQDFYDESISDAKVMRKKMGIKTISLCFNVAMKKKCDTKDSV